MLLTGSDWKGIANMTSLNDLVKCSIYWWKYRNTKPMDIWPDNYLEDNHN